MARKIAFFGNEQLATGVPTKNSAKQALGNAGYMVHTINKDLENIPEELYSIKPDIGILVAYGLIIPQKMLDMFPRGIINIHPSLLPKGRGPAPIEEVILDGSKHAGVSIIKLTEGMDEGPVLAQQTIELTGNETKQELADMLLDLGSRLLIKCLSDVFSGSAKPVPQAKSGATYTRKIKKSDGMINWKKPAVGIEREIRAYAGWPKSRTKINGIDCIIIDADVTSIESGPGDIKTEKDSLLIGCGTGSLLIKRLQPAGKKPMLASEFIRGYIKNSF